MVNPMTTQSDATPAVIRVEALLARVAAGMTDEQDADWLRERLFPEPQDAVVRAYLMLMCNLEAARRHLAVEYRRTLASQLLSDDPVLQGREQDMQRGTWWLIALCIVGIAALTWYGRL